MKICPKCSSIENSYAEFCTNCGHKFEMENKSNNVGLSDNEFSQSKTNTASVNSNSQPESKKGLTKAVNVFLILTIIFSILQIVFYTILLIIPGTESLTYIKIFSTIEESRSSNYYINSAFFIIVFALISLIFAFIVKHKLKKHIKMSTFKKVLTMIFVNFIVGILLLCNKDA